MNRRDPSGEKTVKIVTAGVFAAMITLMTAFVFHIPYGANGGYIHFGDMLIYMAAVFLPKKYAAASAAVGAGIADLLTAPMWAPATVIIKILMVLCFTSGGSKILGKRNCLAPVIGIPICILGYYVAEGILFGSFLTPIVAVPGNMIQSAGSAVIFYLLATVFDRAHLKEKISIAG